MVYIHSKGPRLLLMRNFLMKISENSFRVRGQWYKGWWLIIWSVQKKEKGVSVAQMWHRSDFPINT